MMNSIELNQRKEHTIVVAEHVQQYCRATHPYHEGRRPGVTFVQPSRVQIRAICDAQAPRAATVREPLLFSSIFFGEESGFYFKFRAVEML